MALKGIKVVEMMGLAPGPFCGTILADFGASVTVVDKTLLGISSRHNPQKGVVRGISMLRRFKEQKEQIKIQSSPFDVMSNGKKMLSVNLKSKDGINIVRKLCASSDVFLDTYRPGVMEKLGLGPEILMKNNSRLIYARLTGYGQNGYYSDKAGHDINYVAMSGLLSTFIKNELPPILPINFIADFGGGSLICALGIILALFERTKSGRGQIVDASMTEGAAYVATWIFKSRKLPIWKEDNKTNVLNGGLASYGTYKTKDGKFMAVGAIEPQFYSNFLKGLQLSEDEFQQTSDIEFCKKTFKQVFLTRTQDEWCNIFKNIDACVTPVLDMQSVDKHEYHKSHKSFYRDEDDTILPEPAPKLSHTPGKSVGRQPLPQSGQHTVQILEELGYNKSDIDRFIREGLVYASIKSNL